ncbi:MAG: hypothetical protein KGO53_04755 [Alphaproteobacteria bacterium]|nr:hypothetical protein [Alphaproteobacteria bacterium]
MDKSRPKPLPLIPWDTWQEKLGISVLALALAGVFIGVTFWTSFDTPLSRREATCRLQSWGYWQPSTKGDTARMVARCTLPDNTLISLSQPIGWTPPEIGADINIVIIDYRLSGRAYFAK